MSANLVTESYDGKLIPFQAGDAFVNATAMCAAFGKRPNDFLALSSTKAFQSALSEELKALPENLVTVVRGGNLTATEQGTWLHPDFALECARWLSPKFAIWCNKVIRRILSGELVRPAKELTKLEILEMAIESEKKLQLLVIENRVLAPKGEFYDAVVGSPDLIHLNEAAKILGVGRNKLMAQLREKKILRYNNTPFQEYIDKGYFKLATTHWTHPKDGSVHVHVTTMVKQKGLDFLRRCVKRLKEIESMAALPAPKRSLVAAFQATQRN